MKYIGENAIKKLISLIKVDLATKQDSITATGVLERDTTGVINGVETVGATLVETQEATLVDVPNGLLKGDGTTISAAVSGTDYVNSNQAIRYDAAQSLTDDQKVQARKNIAAAPSEYGLGGISKLLTADDDLDNICLGGWYYWLGSTPQHAPADWSCMRVDCGRAGEKTGVRQYYYRDTLVDKVRQLLADEKWTPWQFVYPPMNVGVEYCTTERYMGKPVYAQLFSVGACSAGSEVNLYKGVGTLNTDKVVSYCGYAADRALPYFVKDTTYNIMLTAQKVEGTYDLAIGLATGTSVSFTESYVVVKYTKTTD